jgi:hypothetical protein
MYSRPVRSQNDLVMPDFHRQNLQAEQAQRTQQVHRHDPYADLRDFRLGTLPVPSHDFRGNRVPDDLARGFKPDSINQYHQLLKAVRYGDPVTAREIKASRKPADWERLGGGFRSFDAHDWKHGGKNLVEQFVRKSVYDTQQQPAVSVQPKHRPAMQNRLLGKLTGLLDKTLSWRRGGKVRPMGGTSRHVKLSATTTYHYPQHNSRKSPYAPRLQGGSYRANQQAQLWRNGQVYHDAQTANIDPWQLKAMTTGSMPLGFANEWQFNRFKAELGRALQRDGIQDSVAGLYGTSTTFYSHNPLKRVNRHFDSKGHKTSHLDLYIRGPNVLETLKNAPLYSDVYGNPIVKTAFPHLKAFSSRWENILGRTVSIVAKPTHQEAWTLHSPSQQPPSRSG